MADDHPPPSPLSVALAQFAFALIFENEDALQHDCPRARHLLDSLGLGLARKKELLAF
jgi:hypothetical protein